MILCIPVKAIEIIGTEDSSDNIQTSSEFADDRVILVMKQDASLKFDTYSTLDFSEISCTNVIDLTADMGELVQQKIEMTETVASD